MTLHLEAVTVDGGLFRCVVGGHRISARSFPALEAHVREVERYQRL